MKRWKQEAANVSSIWAKEQYLQSFPKILEQLELRHHRLSQRAGLESNDAHDARSEIL